MAERCAVSHETDVPFRGQHIDPVTNSRLATKSELVFEFFAKLGRSIKVAVCRLGQENCQDDVALSVALSILLRAHLSPHEPLIHGIDLNPFAIDLVDQFGGQGRTIAQLNLQLALRAFIVGAVKDKP